MENNYRATSDRLLGEHLHLALDRMRHDLQRRGIVVVKFWPILLIPCGVLFGMAIEYLPLQITLIAIVLIILIPIGSSRAYLVAAGCSVYVLGLARRLVNQEAAAGINDPFVVLPIALLVLAFVHANRPSKIQRRPTVNVLCLIMIAVNTASLLVHGNVSAVSGFAYVMNTLPWLVIALISSQALPNIWPTLTRWLQVLGPTAALYGIVQFFFLPTWDKEWMLNSGMESIGNAIPMQVRVFGSAESPGPYAIVLAIALMCLVWSAQHTRGVALVGKLSGILLILSALTLTGVRSVLIGVILTLGVFGALRARGLGRFVVVVCSVALYMLLNAVVARFGAHSQVFNSNRLTSLDAARDPSIQARFQLFQILPSALREPLGSGPGHPPLDNLILDTLVTVGVLGAAAVVVLLTIACVTSVRALRLEDANSSHLASIFLVFETMFGNFLASGAGVLFALAIGSALTISTSGFHPAGVKSVDIALNSDA